MNKIKLIVVAGATASGKTALSIELAKKFDAEIVSCDSMQIYRDMNIGTAKPDEEEKQGIPHHMMDFLSPEESFSVADFTTLAHEKISDIHKRGKRIILAGGTGLYIDSLVNDVDFDEEDCCEALREELRKRAENEGALVLINELRTFDPKSAQKLHPNNLKRIIRKNAPILIKNRIGVLVMANYANGPEIPMGLGMALAQNTRAMEYFTSLPPEDLKRIIEQTSSINSKDEMQRFANSLGTTLGSDLMF